MTVSVAVSITEIVPLFWFGTYANGAAMAGVPTSAKQSTNASAATRNRTRRAKKTATGFTAQCIDTLTSNSSPLVRL